MASSLPSNVKFDHPACLIGEDVNNLHEESISNDGKACLLPFNVNHIKSIRLISSNKYGLTLRKENGYTGSGALLSFNSNTILLYNDVPNSAFECKFEITFI